MACLAAARARLRPLGFGAAAFAPFARRDRVLACLAVAREASEGWWARQDSNLQPDRYERSGRTLSV